MAKVFLSYDRDDSDFAELVQARLAKAGHDTLMDFEILDAGEDWRERLDQAIRESHALVVVMTPEGATSVYVTYEWSFAIGAGIRVIPLEYKSTVFHPRLEVLQRLDFKIKAQRPWDALLLEVEKAAESRPDTTVPIRPGTPPVVKRAIAGLDSTDPAEQKAAVLLLAQADHPLALQALTGALKHPVKDVRLAAAFAFPDMKNPGVLRALIEVCGDWNTWAHWSGERFTFSDRVSMIGTPAIPALLEALHDPDVSIRAAVADALGELHDRAATTGLIDALMSDKHRYVRASAAKALGAIADPASLDALCAALTDESEHVREQAAKALGEIAEGGTLVCLRDALTDEFRDVRAAAASALGKRKDSGAVSKLLELLEADSGKVREACARALGTIGESSAVPGLLQAFRDSNESHDVRIAAAQSLGLLGDRAAVEPLRAQLASADALGYAAAEALAKLKDTASLSLIAEAVNKFGGGSPPNDVVEVLASFGESAVPALASILENRYESLREIAAKALRSIGSSEARAAVKRWERRN